MPGDTYTGDARRIGDAALTEILTEAFQLTGQSHEEAALIARAIVDAELYGVPTHGVLRVPAYLNGLRTGRFNPRADIRPVHESPVSMLLDADNALGYLPAWRAVQAAAERARTMDVGVAGTRNSNEFGRAAFYAEELARQGMIGIVCGNTLPLLGAPGSAAATHGNNPLAFSAPGPDAPLFDAAFTPRSGGELWRRRLLNLPLPAEWGYRDAAGRTITVPQLVGGVMPPIAGAKGFGMALLVDLLAGVLTGAASGPDVPRDNSQVGAFVLALHPNIFGAGAGVPETLRRSAESVRESGGKLPGDRAREHGRRTRETGIAIPAPIFDLLATSLGEPSDRLRTKLEQAASRTTV